MAVVSLPSRPSSQEALQRHRTEGGRQNIGGRPYPADNDDLPLSAAGKAARARCGHSFTVDWYRRRRRGISLRVGSTLTRWWISFSAAKCRNYGLVAARAPLIASMKFECRSSIDGIRSRVSRSLEVTHALASPRDTPEVWH